MSTFTSDKENLRKLLDQIQEVKIQIPEFQRGWVWNDSHIKNLLSSITLAHPIGALMFLETGNPEVKFKPRLIEGVSLDKLRNPDFLLLDGQQRMTSLFQATMRNEPVLTKDHRGYDIKRWYYIDIYKALAHPSVDREDAIFSLREDKLQMSFGRNILIDCSTTEKEAEIGAFPFSIIFDLKAMKEWEKKFNIVDPKNYDIWNEFYEFIVLPTREYLIPLIVLSKDEKNGREAVCQIFEKVNTGGVSLTVFELLTATFAADNFNLREDWKTRKKKLNDVSKLGCVGKVLGSVQSDDLLQTITLLSTYEKHNAALSLGKNRDQSPAISCKRKDVLKLSLSDYQKWADIVTNGFIEAGKFLYSQKIFKSEDIPYRTQLIPLAAIFSVLGKAAETVAVKQKLEKWYWCGVLGELYGGAIETRFSLDLSEFIIWLNDDSKLPKTVSDANFARNRLYTLKTRNSAAYKGIHALIMRDGCRDFIKGTPITEQVYLDENIDIHHIFPRAWCEGKFPENRWNSVVNKTAISASTNKSIGGNAPSIYLPKVLSKAGNITKDQLDSILNTHIIDPKSIWSDDFDSFFNAREEALLQRIESIVGKGTIVDDIEATTEISSNEVGYLKK